MNEMDGRTLGHEPLEAIRIRGVKRVEAGESPEVVIEALGYGLTAARRGAPSAIRRRS
jgi:hypothetical protein